MYLPDTFPLITDPYFYAVTIPAVLLLGVSKSGFGAGFGALAVPMMALAVSVPQAAAILMPVLLVMDLLGMAAFRSDFDLKLLRFLIPWGLVGIAIGALLFKLLDAHLVAGLVGAFTLLFLAQRLLFAPKADSPPPPRWLGAVLTATSGFTSFIAHAGGPPISAYVIPMRLSPVHYTATMAFFFFVVIWPSGCLMPGWDCWTGATWPPRWCCCRLRRWECGWACAWRGVSVRSCFTVFYMLACF